MTTKFTIQDMACEVCRMRCVNNKKPYPGRSDELLWYWLGDSVREYRQDAILLHAGDCYIDYSRLTRETQKITGGFDVDSMCLPFGGMMTGEGLAGPIFEYEEKKDANKRKKCRNNNPHTVSDKK